MPEDKGARAPLPSAPSRARSRRRAAARRRCPHRVGRSARAVPPRRRRPVRSRPGLRSPWSAPRGGCVGRPAAQRLEVRGVCAQRGGSRLHVAVDVGRVGRARRGARRTTAAHRRARTPTGWPRRGRRRGRQDRPPGGRHSSSSPSRGRAGGSATRRPRAGAAGRRARCRGAARGRTQPARRGGRGTRRCAPRRSARRALFVLAQRPRLLRRDTVDAGLAHQQVADLLAVRGPAGDGARRPNSMSSVGDDRDCGAPVFGERLERVGDHHAGDVSRCAPSAAGWTSARRTRPVPPGRPPARCRSTCSRRRASPCRRRTR